MNNSIPPPLIGWPLLPLPDQYGQLNYPTLEVSVRQTIQAILRTRPGEQLMRPTFGGGLQQFIHEPNTITTRRRIRDQITLSLQSWEPRIIVDLVDVTEVAGQPGQVRVDIAYRLQRNGLAQRLGATIDLEA